MRALLNLMHENEAVVRDLSVRCQALLCDASANLKVLGPDRGETELVKLFAARLIKLSLPLRKPQTLNPGPWTLHPKS